MTTLAAVPATWLQGVALRRLQDTDSDSGPDSGQSVVRSPQSVVRRTRAVALHVYSQSMCLIPCCLAVCLIQRDASRLAADRLCERGWRMLRSARG